MKTMKTRKQIRHTYIKYLLIYMAMTDAHQLEAADHWWLRAETLATDVLDRTICHDIDRLIRCRERQQHI